MLLWLVALAAASGVALFPATAPLWLALAAQSLSLDVQAASARFSYGEWALIAEGVRLSPRATGEGPEAAPLVVGRMKLQLSSLARLARGEPGAALFLDRVHTSLPSLRSLHSTSRRFRSGVGSVHDRRDVTSFPFERLQLRTLILELEAPSTGGDDHLRLEASLELRCEAAVGETGGPRALELTIDRAVVHAGGPPLLNAAGEITARFRPQASREHGVLIEQVEARGLEVSVERRRDGAICVAGLTVFRPGGARAEHGDRETPSLTIGRLRIDGGRIRFLDRTVDPPVSLVAEEVDLLVRDANTATLGAFAGQIRLSREAGETPDEQPPLKTTISAFAVLPAVLEGLTVFGRFSPTDSLEGTVAAGLFGLKLPSLSCYSQPHLNLSLRRGTATTRIDLSLDQRGVRGVQRLFARDPQVAGIGAAKALVAGRNLFEIVRDLKRADGTLDLTLGVRGTWEEVGVHGASLLAEAVRQIVGTTLDRLLAPIQRRLPPDDRRRSAVVVGFVADTEEVHAERLTGLRQLAALVRNRPEAALVVRGVARAHGIANPREPIGSSPRELAESRALAIRAILVEAGVEGSQILLRRPILSGCAESAAAGTLSGSGVLVELLR
ncbi:DUF748 domain-containing protein [Planctomycetota bacterium]